MFEDQLDWINKLVEDYMKDNKVATESKSKSNHSLRQEPSHQQADPHTKETTGGDTIKSARDVGSVRFDMEDTAADSIKDTTHVTVNTITDKPEDNTTVARDKQDEAGSKSNAPIDEANKKKSWKSRLSFKSKTKSKELKEKIR